MFTRYVRRVPAPPDRAPLERDAIVAAARDLVREAGLESLSLRRLASRLGVTAAAIYAHVRNKRDLLRSIAELEFERLLADFAARRITDPTERVRAHLHAYVDYARREPELFRVMFLFPPGLRDAAVPDDLALPAATEAFASAAEAVGAAAAAGDIDTSDLLVTSLAFWSAAHGVATVLQLGLGFPAEVEDRLVDEVIDRLLAGYRPGSRPT